MGWSHGVSGFTLTHSLHLIRPAGVRCYIPLPRQTKEKARSWIVSHSLIVSRAQEAPSRLAAAPYRGTVTSGRHHPRHLEPFHRLTPCALPLCLCTPMDAPHLCCRPEPCRSITAYAIYCRLLDAPSSPLTHHVLRPDAECVLLGRAWPHKFDTARLCCMPSYAGHAYLPARGKGEGRKRLAWGLVWASCRTCPSLPKFDHTARLASPPDAGHAYLHGVTGKGGVLHGG